MKYIKFILPAMLLAFVAFAAEDDCRVRSPEANKGKVVDGAWVPTAADYQS